MDMRRSTFWTVCIALASFLMFAEVVLGASSSPWILVSNMITARDQFAGCVIGDKIYVFGGNDNPDGINLNSGEVYDIGSVTIRNTQNIRNWGTTRGLGELSTGPVPNKTKYDAYGVVRCVPIVQINVVSGW